MTKENLLLNKEKIIKEKYLPSIDELIGFSNFKEKELLYELSNDIRKHYCKNHIDLCSITNAKSGKCPENCKWCSQSSHSSSNIPLYEIIEKETAINNAVDNFNKGVHRHSLVTSGKSATDKQLDNYIEIYQEIKKRCNINLCASFGLLEKNQLLKLKNAGISKYHCNIETAPSIFSKYCTSHSIEEKIKTIKYAKEIGLNVCSGVILGMGEGLEHRIEMALTLRELEIKSIPINIYMPIEGTQLKNPIPLEDDEILTSIAIFRFVNPDSYLRIAGGRIQIKHLESKMLSSGINASIVGDLLTTIGSSVEEDLKLFKNTGFSY